MRVIINENIDFLILHELALIIERLIAEFSDKETTISSHHPTDAFTLYLVIKKQCLVI